MKLLPPIYFHNPFITRERMTTPKDLMEAPLLGHTCSHCDPESPIPHEQKALRLRIANLCCAGEERIIRRVLGEMKGIDDLKVNVVGRYAVLKHCPATCCAPTEVIVDYLNKERLGASIQEHFDETTEETEENTNPWILAHATITTALFIACSVYDGIRNEDTSLNNEVNMLYVVCGIFGSIPIAWHAGESLLRKNIDINLLVMIALIGSFAGKDWRDGALVIVLFVIAKVLEEVVMHYVRNAIKISSSNVGRFALLIDGSNQKQVLLEDLRVGDHIAVRTGDMIPIDGTVASGQAVVDESAITGEAAFIHKAVGSKVLSGAIVQNGYVEMTVDVELKDSVMKKLNDTVNDVQASKGQVATIVDNFAAYWTPFIVLSAIVFVTAGGSATGNWHGFITKGLVLIVLACPCSIVLAAPVASLSGIAAAAKHGVVIKGSEVIEQLGLIDCVTLDKTGTLTKGSFSVLETLRFKTDKEADEEVDDEVYDPMKLAAALEDKSSHPLANAIVSKFCGCIAEMKNPLPESKKIQINDGVGVEGWVEVNGNDWVHVAVGNERLLKGGISFKSAGEHTQEKEKKLVGANKCPLKKGQQQKIAAFIEKYPACTIVFVSVDDELALCMALGGEKDD